MRVSGVVPFGGAWLVDLHVYCRRLISWPPMSTGLSIHVHADIRHSRHIAYLHRFHFQTTVVETLGCAVFRVAEMRVVGFAILRLLQLSGIMVHTDLCCC